MTTTVQALLIIMILLLGATLMVIGVQVFFVLKELRQSIKRTNKILLDAETVSTSVANAATQVTETLEKAKSAFSLAMLGKRVWELIRGEDSEVEEGE